MVSLAAMLETLSKGFRLAREKLTGQAELSEENIEAALRDVRMSLLEADVALPVVRSFLQRVKDKSVGQIVKLRAKAEVPVESKTGEKSLKSMEVTPEWHFIKICQALVDKAHAIKSAKVRKFENFQEHYESFVSFLDLPSEIALYVKQRIMKFHPDRFALTPVLAQ